MAINRIDQAVIQLRAQLQRVARNRGQRGSSGAIGQAPIERLRALNNDHRDEPDFRRAFVRAILLEALGDGLAEHSEFEAIAAEVTRQIDEDPHMRLLVDQAMAQLD